MIAKQQIEATINQLYDHAKHDQYKMVKGLSKRIFRPMQPSDFKDAYLSISREQGEYLVNLIKENRLENIIEFGTSFGISTLFLAQGVIETGGQVITTEVIESKAQKAIENFKNAGVNELIEVKIGDALETLKNYDKPIDLLLLDGWKNLYLHLFQMLSPNFNAKTIIYVDNADMPESKLFLKTINQNPQYQLQNIFGGKVVLITISKI